MTARRFVIVEADQTVPEYGAQYALDPASASAIPIPAFKAGPALPASALMDGEGFFNTATKQAYIWNQGSWVPVSPSTIVAYTDDAAVLADTTPGVGSIGSAASSGNMYVKTPSGWRFLGIRSFATVADLNAASLADGSAGFVLSDGSIWMRVNGVWTAQTRRQFPTYADLITDWATGADGEAAHVSDENTDWVRVGSGATWRCQTMRPLADRAALTAWSPGYDGEHAFLSSENTEWVRVGTGDTWRCLSMRRFASHADLTAWSTGYKGELALIESEGSEWLRTDAASGWKCLTTRPVASYTELKAWSSGFKNERAFIPTEGTEWIRRDTGSGWQCLDRRVLSTFADMALWTAAEGFDGDLVHIDDEDTDWIRIGKTGTWKCQSLRYFPTALDLLAWSPGQQGERAYNKEDNTEWVRIGNNTWRCETQRPLTDKAALDNWKPGVVGEMAYLRSDGSQWVRSDATLPDGKWRCTTQHVFDTYADLISQWTTGYAGERAYVKDEDTTWVRVDDANTWVCQGTRPLATLAEVLAWSAPDGATATAADYPGGQLSRVGNAWIPRGVWVVATEADMLANTTMVSGQTAVAMDTRRTYTWDGTAWIGQPIRHYPTEAALQADSPPDGTLAWADDTNHVFTRGGGHWLSTDLPPTGWAVDWKDDVWPKDSLVVVDGKIWRAKSVIQAGSPKPSAPAWEKVGGGSGWETIIAWDETAAGSHSFTPDWTQYAAYRVELNSDNAVFVKSAKALSFTGVQSNQAGTTAAYKSDLAVATERQVCPDVSAARVTYTFTKTGSWLELHVQASATENIVATGLSPTGLVGEFTARSAGGSSGTITGLLR